MENYDVAVIGLGIVGSSVLARLSEKYRSVGIDQFIPPHTKGSSHGENRIIRAAPSEGLIYAQLAARSFALFEEIAKKSGRTFVYKTGGFDCSTSPSQWAETAKKTCEHYRLPYEEMSGKELNRRYGNFQLPDDAQVILQPEYGHVDAEGSWQGFLDIARNNQADLLLNTKIEHVDLFGKTLSLGNGSKIRAEKIIVCAGSWLKNLIDLRMDLRVQRRVLAWYEIEDPHADIIPFCFADGKNGGDWYGMPSLDRKRLKIGEHNHLSENIRPEEETAPNEKDRNLLSHFVREYTKGINLNPASMAVCRYTLTSDEHFIMDRHPAHDGVYIFSCCSGHGFKYAPVYGEIAESFVDGKKCEFDLGIFKIDRHIRPAPPVAGVRPK